MPEQTFLEAIRAGLEEEMRRDPTVYIFGEDVALGGPFGVTKGLAETFGANRTVNTPISEATVMGLAIGAATAGLRPVVEIMFIDFITLAMDQLVNHAAKLALHVRRTIENTVDRARPVRHQRRHGRAPLAEPGVLARPCAGIESRHAGQSRRRQGFAEKSPSATTIRWCSSNIAVSIGAKAKYRTSDESVAIGKASIMREGNGYHRRRALEHGGTSAGGGGRTRSPKASRLKSSTRERSHPSISRPSPTR